MTTFQLSDDERLSWLRLTRTDRIGPVTFANLLGRFGTASKALEALPDLARAGGRSAIRIHPVSAAHEEIDRSTKLGARWVAPGEAGYPPFLRHVHGAPPMICVKGQLHVADMDQAAIVGARNASANGLRFTRIMAQKVAEHGISVASGLARGIDTAAHEAARATIAVLAGGIDHIYPPENDKLYAAIAERGLIISEMPIGTAPKAEHFPRRNRIISGVSRVVIVIEAALRSGSLITARYAAEQGRDVFAVPGSPLDPRCEGCNRLIRDGATILTSLDDVLDALRQTPAPQTAHFMELEAPYLPAQLSDSDRNCLVSFLSPTETPIDDLIRESGLAPEKVAAILLELEIAGRVARSVGGRISMLSSTGTD